MWHDGVCMQEKANRKAEAARVAGQTDPLAPPPPPSRLQVRREWQDGMPYGSVQGSGDNCVKHCCLATQETKQALQLCAARHGSWHCVGTRLMSALRPALCSAAAVIG